MGRLESYKEKGKGARGGGGVMRKRIDGEEGRDEIRVMVM